MAGAPHPDVAVGADGWVLAGAPQEVDVVFDAVFDVDVDVELDADVGAAGKTELNGFGNAGAAGCAGVAGAVGVAGVCVFEGAAGAVLGTDD